ncbi:MAG: hypothetical protein WC695_08285 [Candidatus Omnitrophota bacterium]
MRRKWLKRAQTTAEYAVLIALVIGAVVAMQIYVKRGMQNRIKNVVDYTGLAGTENVAGSPFSLSGNQYEPYYANSHANTQQRSGDDVQMQLGGSVNRISNSSTNAVRNATASF